MKKRRCLTREAELLVEEKNRSLENSYSKGKAVVENRLSQVLYSGVENILDPVPSVAEKQYWKDKAYCFPYIDPADNDVVLAFPKLEKKAPVYS
jgi:hypothetical protein